MTKSQQWPSQLQLPTVAHWRHLQRPREACVALNNGVVSSSAAAASCFVPPPSAGFASALKWQWQAPMALLCDPTGSLLGMRAQAAPRACMTSRRLCSASASAPAPAPPGPCPNEGHAAPGILGITGALPRTPPHITGKLIPHVYRDATSAGLSGEQLFSRFRHKPAPPYYQGVSIICS